MISDLDKAVAYSIRDLVSKMSRRLRKQICFPEQLSFTELNIFRLLSRNEQLTPSELCAQLNISSQYMSQVLNKLEELEFVKREASLQDKRKSFVSLTEKGKAKIDDARHVKEEWLAEAIAKQYAVEDKELIQKAVILLLTLTDL
jgi:DNA-binding MarR family transcriptional regulator